MKVDEKSVTALQFILIALALFASWQMQYNFAAIILRLTGLFAYTKICINNECISKLKMILVCMDFILMVFCTGNIIIMNNVCKQMKTGFMVVKHLLADIDAAIIIAMTGLLIRNLTKKYKEKEA
jgi:hypothetical protein